MQADDSTRSVWGLMVIMVIMVTLVTLATLATGAVIWRLQYAQEQELHSLEVLQNS